MVDTKREQWSRIYQAISLCFILLAQSNIIVTTDHNPQRFDEALIHKLEVPVSAALQYSNRESSKQLFQFSRQDHWLIGRSMVRNRSRVRNSIVNVNLIRYLLYPRSCERNARKTCVIKVENMSDR